MPKQHPELQVLRSAQDDRVARNCGRPNQHDSVVRTTEEEMMDKTGFTLIEVLMAMVILGFAVMGAQAIVTDRLLGNVVHEDTRATARQLVEDRLQLVQTDPQYAELADRYAGDESDLPTFPGYHRSTYVAPQADHTIVTVQVVTPAATDTLSGTAVIGVQ
jgi:prepilin-type N-terminal cleavage/methylation domain-containing protein